MRCKFHVNTQTNLSQYRKQIYIYRTVATHLSLYVYYVPIRNFDYFQNASSFLRTIKIAKRTTQYALSNGQSTNNVRTSYTRYQNRLHVQTTKFNFSSIVLKPSSGFTRVSFYNATLPPWHSDIELLFSITVTYVNLALCDGRIRS